MKTLSFICAILGMSLFGRYTVSEKDWEKTTKIVFRHADAAIAPHLFRCYSLTVTAEKVVVEVRDYDKTLLTKRYPYTAKDYQIVIQHLKMMEVWKVKERGSMAGGDSESLSLYKGEEEYFSAYASHGEGTLRLRNGDLETIIHKIVPKIDEMVEQTRTKNE